MAVESTIVVGLSLSLGFPLAIDISMAISSIVSKSMAIVSTIVVRLGLSFSFPLAIDISMVVVGLSLSLSFPLSIDISVAISSIVSKSMAIESTIVVGLSLSL